MILYFKISPWRKGIEASFNNSTIISECIWSCFLFNFNDINNFVYFCFFRVGYRWLSKLFALTFYAVLLMPGFIQGLFICLFIHYAFTSNITWFVCCIPSSVSFALYPFFIIDLFLNFSLTVGYYYFFSSHIKRSVVYGDQPRNRCVMCILFDKALNCHCCQTLILLLSLTWVVDKIY